MERELVESTHNTTFMVFDIVNKILFKNEQNLDQNLQIKTENNFMLIPNRNEINKDQTVRWDIQKLHTQHVYT